MKAHELPGLNDLIAEFGKKTLRAGDYISYHSADYGDTGSGGSMVQPRILAIDPDNDRYSLTLDTGALLISTWKIRSDKDAQGQRQLRNIRTFELVNSSISALTRREQFAEAIRDLPENIMAELNSKRYTKRLEDWSKDNMSNGDIFSGSGSNSDTGMASAQETSCPQSIRSAAATVTKRSVNLVSSSVYTQSNRYLFQVPPHKRFRRECGKELLNNFARSYGY
ncbi:hypothetical protein F442_19283 [Phytophthora nicotianae P10297]|uniref:Uncharacterized protein n=1 Tax=Phytophthora nicotianae P10297 TaxID=1317064 RepID=W2YAY5_PHYNI|nr:hypothetical protein F442_19283 [Phytophthora nicotianae P10297]